MCTKFGMVLLHLVLQEVVGWMINCEYHDRTVILALSLTVWPTSFMPGLSDILFRPYTSLEASQFERKWSRFAPFSTMKSSRKKALWYGKIVCHSYRYNKNILTTETTTVNPSVTPCRVWKMHHIFINTNFYSPDPGSEFGSLFL